MVSGMNFLGMVILIALVFLIWCNANSEGANVRKVYGRDSELIGNELGNGRNGIGHDQTLDGSKTKKRSVKLVDKMGNRMGQGYSKNGRYRGQAGSRRLKNAKFLYRQTSVDHDSQPCFFKLCPSVV